MVSGRDGSWYRSGGPSRDFYGVNALFRVQTALVIILVVAPVWGCASSRNAPDEKAASSNVQGQPPEREPEGKLPDGPPVKVSQERAGGERGEAEARGGESSAAQPPGENHERVRESEVERLLGYGPSYLFQAVTVEPVKREDQFRGYRIVEATDAARRVMRPQLEIGDVVQVVNGVPIERPDDYMEAWNKLEERAVFEVEYVRDGEAGEAHWVVEERAAK